ncbi:hypothetical protein ISCGN_005119 [Ixodes scapularis]
MKPPLLSNLHSALPSSPRPPLLPAILVLTLSEKKKRKKVNCGVGRKLHEGRKVKTCREEDAATSPATRAAHVVVTATTTAAARSVCFFPACRRYLLVRKAHSHAFTKRELGYVERRHPRNRDTFPNEASAGTS